MAETIAKQKKRKEAGKSKKRKRTENLDDVETRVESPVASSHDRMEASAKVKEEKETKSKDRKKKNKKKKRKKETRPASSIGEPSEKQSAPSMNQSASRDREASAASQQQEEQVSSKDNGDDSDGDLLAAAAGWATQADDDKEDSNNHDGVVNNDCFHRSSYDLQLPINATYSVHVTKVAFDATESDVRQHFANADCVVTSVRLVYDRGLDQQRLFRGVAFVDVADQGSFEAALNLHRTALLGHRINVRPTRTREELMNIVKQTEERVLRSLKLGKVPGRGERTKHDVQGSTTTQVRARNEKEKKRARKRGSEGDSEQRESREADGSKHHARWWHKKQLAGNGPLTKKQRNRRAAIIQSMKRKRN